MIILGNKYKFISLEEQRFIKKIGVKSLLFLPNSFRGDT